MAPLHLINAPYKIDVLLRSAFGIALCYELIDVGFPCVNPTYGRGDRTQAKLSPV